MKRPKHFVERVVGERLVYQGIIFGIYERDIQITPDRTVTWQVIKGKDAVAVVAMDDHNNVLLLEEYFGAQNQRGFKLPGGVIDAGENAESAVQRELAEEVGLSAQKLELLAAMTSLPGYFTGKTHVFLATGLEQADAEGDEEHYIQLRKVPLRRAVEMCGSGEIQEARTVAGILLASNKLAAV
jgi:8-oxo-dGTP pyrophosphatase MutT (NUDIX family)